MISLRNILVIANFESRILWRNWFFKIFTLLVLFFGTVFNIGVFSTVDNEDWWLRAISAGIPNATMVFLNMFQSAVIIFLATGIIKNNKKLDTNEVFFVRPLSNADLVIGKAAALLKLFLLLNLLAMTIALIVNTTIPDTGINFMAYLIYPAITSLPNIIFTTGLTFFVVSIVRNQAVSIILMLGILGMVLIYFRESYNYILDFPAIQLPIYYSDIAGFANTGQIIQQRSIFILLGIGLTFASIFFIERLPQKKYFRITSGMISLLLLAASTSLVITYIRTDEEKWSLRQAIIEVNGEFANLNNVYIHSSHLQLEHVGEQINCQAIMGVKNDHQIPLDHIFFALNPGLEVTKITVNGIEKDFERKTHMISINGIEPIREGQTATVEFIYSGSIDETMAYLSVAEEDVISSEKDFFYRKMKRYSFLQPNYVLLTNEVIWYPQTKVGYNKINPVADVDNFIDFTLEVKTKNNLVAVSQGKMEKTEAGNFHFKPETLLPKISLAIGHYKEYSIEVDSINYQLFYHKNNDYFSGYFDQLADTMQVIIKDLKNSYQVNQNLKYKFKRLQLVEAPTHFFAHAQMHENHQGYVQPATVLLPEKGGRIRELDFKEQFRIAERQAKRNNQVLDDKDKQVNIFKTFVKTTLTKQLNEKNFRWWDAERNIAKNYSIFPNLYDYTFGVSSSKWPLLQKNIAGYLSNDVVNANSFRRNIRGIAFEEECNSLMQEKTLQQILVEEEEAAKIAKVIQLKGDYLFTYLEHKIGAENFKSFLQESITQNKHKIIDYANFRQAILDQFDLDIEPVVDRIYTQTAQPAFIVSDIKEYQVLDGNRNRFQIIFEVENMAAVDGLLKISLKYSSDDNNSNDQSPTEKFPKLVLVASNEKKQVRLLLDNKPSRILVNTLISKNVPSIINLQLGQFNLNSKAKPQEGDITLIANGSDRINEIIVDNEDSAFTTFSRINEAYLKKLIAEKNKDKEPEYYGIWRGSRTKWQPTTGSSFFGKYVRSAHFTRSGNGEKMAIWTPKIEENGYYDIYIHMTGGTQGFNVSNNNRKSVNYHYKIFHDDGEDNITFDINKADRGWNFVGTFYISDGNGKVTQSDRSEHSIVYADAVKWVKQ